jgi:hypothetical protein
MNQMKRRKRVVTHKRNNKRQFKCQELANHEILVTFFGGDKDFSMDLVLLTTGVSRSDKEPSDFGTLRQFPAQRMLATAISDHQNTDHFSLQGSLKHDQETQKQHDRKSIVNKSLTLFCHATWEGNDIIKRTRMTLQAVRVHLVHNWQQQVARPRPIRDDVVDRQRERSFFPSDRTRARCFARSPLCHTFYLTVRYSQEFCANKMLWQRRDKDLSSFFETTEAKNTIYFILSVSVSSRDCSLSDQALAGAELG